MRLLVDCSEEVIPPGKRTVRANRWGNVNAYVGGRFWKTLGPEYSVGIDDEIQRFLNNEENTK